MPQAKYLYLDLSRSRLSLPLKDYDSLLDSNIY